MQTGGYEDNQDLGIEGQIADTMKADMVSLQNAESAGVGFGLGVVDAGSGTFDEPDAVTDKLRGVLVHSHAYDNADLDAAGVPTKQMGDVMTRGRVIVFPETEVAEGDEAYCRFANGVADAALVTKGKWRNSDDSYTAMHVNKARFRSAAAAGAPAVLELLDGFGEPDLVYIDKFLSTLTDSAGTGAAAVTHGDITDDLTVELGAVPTGRHVKVKSASLSIGVAAGDDTDHWIIQVQSGTGPTVLAAYDTDTEEDGAITQNTPKAMNVAVAAGKSGERLKLHLNKLNSGATISPGAFSMVLEVY